MRSLPSCSRDVGSQPRTAAFGWVCDGTGHDQQDSGQRAAPSGSRSGAVLGAPRRTRRGLGTSALRRVVRRFGGGWCSRGAPLRRRAALPTGHPARPDALLCPRRLTACGVRYPVRPLSRGRLRSLGCESPSPVGATTRGAPALRGAGGFGRSLWGWLATFAASGACAPPPGDPGPLRRLRRGVPAAARLRPGRRRASGALGCVPLPRGSCGVYAVPAGLSGGHVDPRTEESGFGPPPGHRASVRADWHRGTSRDDSSSTTSGSWAGRLLRGLAAPYALTRVRCALRRRSGRSHARARALAWSSGLTRFGASAPGGRLAGAGSEVGCAAAPLAVSPHSPFGARALRRPSGCAWCDARHVGVLGVRRFGVCRRPADGACVLAVASACCRAMSPASRGRAAPSS